MARIASRIDSLQGNDVYRINDLVKTRRMRTKAAALNYGPPSQLGEVSQSKEDVKMRKRTEEVHSGTMTLVCLSGAAYGDQSGPGKCRLGYVMD